MQKQISGSSNSRFASRFLLHYAQHGEFFGWGWSSENEAAARVMTESQLAMVQQLYAAGELRERQRRYYSDRPMRESVEIGREDSSILVRDSG